MFDRNKIIFNNRRSFKASNKKVNLFLSKLSEDAIQRLEIDKRKKNNVLEILAKSNIFVKTLEKKNIKTETFQTFFPNTINFNQKNMIINNNKLSAIDDEKIDCCISFFPAFAKSDLTFILKSIYRILKFEGKFLFLFFSSDSCSKLKKIFYDIFKTKFEDMFMPSPDILLLGNITNLMGYKNVVVDKSSYIITNKTPEDIWGFIRDLGVSNYLQNRNKTAISKINYNELREKIKLLLTEDGVITNKVSINYLIGTKKH